MKKNSALKNSQLSTPNSQLFSESGQTLLEALVALTTAVVIISALSVLVISSLNNAQFSKNQNRATQFAQQGIEILKNQSQSDWTTFSSKIDINYCMSQSNDLTKRIDANCGPNLGIFSREVTINQYAVGNIDASCPPSASARAKVTVSVGWADNKCTSATDVYCHKVKISSCIYKDTIIPTP